MTLQRHQHTGSSSELDTCYEHPRLEAPGSAPLKDLPQIVPAHDYDIPAGTATENTKPGEYLGDPHQSWAKLSKPGLTPSPSNVLSPISPIARDVLPPSTIVSQNTETRDALGSGTVEYHQEVAGGWIPPSSSPLQSTFEKQDNTSYAFVPCETYLADSQSVSYTSHPQHLRLRLSDSDVAIQSSNVDKSSESEASPSMTHSIVTRVDISRSENASLLPTVSSEFPPRVTRIESGTQSNNYVRSPREPSQPATDFNISSSPRLARCRTKIVTQPTVQEIDMLDNDIWEINAEPSCETQSSTFSSFDSIVVGDESIKSAWGVDTREYLSNDSEGDGKLPEQHGNFQDDCIQEADRSDAWDFLSHPNVQLRSPLDPLIATITSELHSTSPQAYSEHRQGHSAPQHHFRDPVNSHTLSVKSLPQCFNHNSILVSKSAPTPIQIEELQELFRIINSEWMERMQPLPELYLLCKTISTSDLFIRAVRVLKDIICRRHTHDFEGIFAMMHLALAAAFDSTRRSDFDSFDVLLDDALQWQHALPHDEDKILFRSAMSCWRLPELEPTSLLSSNSHKIFASGTSQRSFQCGESEILSDRLRDSEVYKLCIGLLEGKSIRS